LRDAIQVPRVAARRSVACVAFDEDLAGRVRELISGTRGLTEQRMFGGLAFLVNGHMAVTVSRQGGLMLHVDPREGEALLRRAHVSPFEMRGRELAGWVRVDVDGLRTRRQLQAWVTRGVAYARTLPPKR
jgi:hypothetical protein